jgi:hypothetical protein
VLYLSAIAIFQALVERWSQALYKKPPYNTITDFAALGLAPKAHLT